MPNRYATQVSWDIGNPSLHKFSFEGLRAPDQFYPADIVSMGPIRRAIGPVNESYSVGNVAVGLINRARRFSALKATEVFKGTRLRAYFGSIADGLAAMFPTFAGSVETYRISNGVLTLNARDMGFDRFKQPLHATLKTLNATIFPDLPTGQPEVLIPVIYGDVSTNGGNTREGAPIPCYRIDDDAGSGKPRYVIAQHVCKSVDAIYVYGVLLGSGYAVSNPTYDGVQMTVVDFDVDPKDADRPNEMEVTALVKGMTDDGTTGGNLIENVAEIDEHLMLNYAGWSASELDSTLYTAAVDAADDNLYAGVSSPYVGCLVICGDINQDWFGINQSITESWLMYKYMTTANQLGVYLLTNTVAETALTPDVTVTDKKDVAATSFEVSGNPNVYSAIHYQWVFNFAFGKFVSSRVTTATTTIARKAPVTSAYRKAPVTSSYRKAPVEFIGGTTTGATVAETSVADARPILHRLHYVSDNDTARNVAETYKLLALEGVEFASFDLPARYIGTIDLNDAVAITHWQGIASDAGGYVEAVFRIVALETYQQPSQKRLRCTGIKLAA